MNKIRLVIGILVPPTILLTWTVIDQWRLIAHGIVHPIISELKLHVFPWLILAAPVILILIRFRLCQYWHFALAAATVGPFINYWSWWWTQAGEDALDMFYSCGLTGLLIAPVMGLLVWLLVGYRAN